MSSLLREMQERIELEARAKLAEERLADLKQHLEEMKRQSDKWQEQAERLALAPSTSPIPLSQPRGCWPFRRRA